MKGSKLGLIASALFLCGGVASAAVDSGCTGCHTDAATMQRLFVPPAQTASEGEG